LCRRHHHEIQALFDEVLSSSGEARKEACRRLIHKCAVHEAAEEIVVHPLDELTGAGKETVRHLLSQEDTAKRFLVKFEKMDPEAADFEQQAQFLKTAIVTHAEQEEQAEHPDIRENNSPETLRRLAAVFRAAEATAPTHAHPGVPSTATATLLVGPVASIIDRTRDAVSEAKRKAGL
jgi:hypothetical protein